MFFWSKKNRRGKFLISPKFQLTTIAVNVVLAIVAIGIFYAENLYLFSKFTGSGVPAAWLNDPTVARLIFEEKMKLNIAFFGTAFVFLGLMVLTGLMLSHRAAGPVYRLHQHMKSVASGQTDEDVKFRKNDFFHELDDAFNLVLAHYRGAKPKIRKIK